jgi:hypothetical protein
VQVACGARHTAAVTSSGDLLCWGWNSYGQCGQGACSQAAASPALVAALGGLRVVAVAAGLGHTVAATGGSTAGRRLRSPPARPPARPGRLAGTAQPPHTRLLAHAVGASSHALHQQRDDGACAADAGDVFAWGWNDSGQLGLGRHRSSSSSGPQLVECAELGRLQAVQVRGGCGRCRSGRGPPARKPQAQRSRWVRQCWQLLLPLPLPPCAQVACGSRHTAVVTACGRAFSWGLNQCGQLGCGDTRDRLAPCAVLPPARQEGGAAGAVAAAGAAAEAGTAAAAALEPERQRAAEGAGCGGGTGSDAASAIPAVVLQGATRVVCGQWTTWLLLAGESRALGGASACPAL